MHAAQLKLALEHFKMCKFIVAVPNIRFKVCLEGCYREELCLLRMQVWQRIPSANMRLVLKVALAIALLLSSSTILHRSRMHVCLAAAACVLFLPVCSLLFLRCDPFQVSQQAISLCSLVLLSVACVVFNISRCWTKCLQIGSLCFKRDFWFSSQSLALFLLQLHKLLLCLHFIHIHGNHLQAVLLLAETSKWFYFHLLIPAGSHEYQLFSIKDISNSLIMAACLC